MDRSERVERIASGLCERQGCPELSADGYTRCDGHVEENRIGAKDRRVARRNAGLCAMCGKRKSRSYRCRRCYSEYRKSRARSRRRTE